MSTLPLFGDSEPPCGSQDFPARTSPAPASEKGGKANDPSSSSTSSGKLRQRFRSGSSWRTSPACSLFEEEPTSESSSPLWSTSGIASPGECWTRGSSGCPSDVDVSSSLRDILEPPDQIPQKYWLSARAAAGILERASRRGRALPEPLRVALEAVASRLTTSEPSSPEAAAGPTTDQALKAWCSQGRSPLRLLAAHPRGVVATSLSVDPARRWRRWAMPNGWVLLLP